MEAQILFAAHPAPSQTVCGAAQKTSEIEKLIMLLRHSKPASEQHASAIRELLDLAQAGNSAPLWTLVDCLEPACIASERSTSTYMLTYICSRTDIP